MNHQILMINNEQEFNKEMNNNDIDDQKAYLDNNDNFFQPLCTENMGKYITLELLKNIMEKPKNDLISDEYEETIDSVYLIKNSKNSNEELQSTENTSTNKSNFEKKEDFFYKIINFKTKLHHKRGRKETIGIYRKKAKKYHTSDDFDNIQRKIQVHFINFLIRLANDAILSILGKKFDFYFKDIKYALKKIVNHNHIEYMKQCKYADIIKMQISSKNKNFEENHNQNIYFRVCKASEELERLFEKNYLYIFQKFYFCLKEDENVIDIDGIQINLSPKTKGFYHLLKKNQPNKEKFNNIVRDVYFSKINHLKSKFITKNI